MATHEPVGATHLCSTSRGIETFYGPIQAIRGVSLQVAQGQIVTVLGANGAGKTTVLRTISGVLDPERGGCASRAATSPTCRPTA